MEKPSPTSSISVREEERRHLARLLQTRLGGPLGLLLAQANAYRAALSPTATQARQAMQTLAGMVSQALADLRDLVADLDPGDIDDLELGVALEALALRVERRYGLVITLDLPTGQIGRTPALPPYLTLTTYRIAQEALSNAAEHAGAGRVGLSLRMAEDGLRLTVADDGSGFQAPEPLEALTSEGKRGLAEMVERAAAVGGQVEISSVLGVGTQVRADLPLAPKPDQPVMDAGLPLVEPLTPREREVLAGVAAGLTNKQIAARLGISDRTVQFHLGNVLGKLGVASRTEAAVLALQHKLV